MIGVAKAVDEGIVSAQREGALRQVRSTLLCSSVAELRHRGLFDRYAKTLPRAVFDVVVHGVAATWLPLEVADAHYAACDRLGLSNDESFSFGATSADRVQNAFLKTLMVVARGAGATPFVALARYPRLWGRHFDGGDAIITRLGAKEVSLDIGGFPLVRYAFFRHAFRGGTVSGFRLFARSAVVREAAFTASSVSFRIAWS